MIQKRLSSIPREKYKEEHRKLWMWLAEHPDKEKEDYFEDWERFSRPYSHCFACEAAIQLKYKLYQEKCNYCPLGKNNIGCNDDSLNSLYLKWWNSQSSDERTSLALQIANLPWEDKN